MTQQTQSTGESFADLFERESPRIKEGEVVRGRVLSVDADHVHVDIGFKSEGLVDSWEFMDEQGTVLVKAGDLVDVLVEETEESHQTEQSEVTHPRSAHHRRPRAATRDPSSRTTATNSSKSDSRVRQFTSAGRSAVFVPYFVVPA